MTVDAYSILLFLHVLGAIAAFGPGFAALVAAPLVAREPQHAGFFARTQATTNRRLVIPLSISLALTGGGLIGVVGWEAATGDKRWLETAIALYVVALVYSMAVQARASRRLVALTDPAAGAAPAEIAAAASRARRGGLLLTGLVVVITWLMVAKPF